MTLDDDFRDLQDLDRGPLERLWWESDVQRKLQIAKDLGSAIARQSPEVTPDEVESYYRGYSKAVDIIWKLLLGK